MLLDEELSLIEGYKVDLLTQPANTAWAKYKSSILKDFEKNRGSFSDFGYGFSDYLWQRFFEEHNGIDIPNTTLVKFINEEDVTAFMLRWR